MKIFYFTSTGNCLNVAKELGGQLYSIPQLLKSKEMEFEDDVIGFVFPIYAFAAPEIVCKFIKNVKIKSKYTFAVMTYGNSAGGCGSWFAKLALKQGIRIDYAKSIKMIDNYLPQFNVKVQKEKDKNIPAQLKQVKDDISTQKHEIEKGSLLMTQSMQLFKKTLVASCEKFTIKDDCNGCGTCAMACPTGNIRIDKKPKFGKECESCLGCVNICPKKAIIIKGEKNPNERFRNENITTKEILEANNVL